MSRAVRAAAVSLALLAVGWGVVLLAGSVVRSEDHVRHEFDGVATLMVDTEFESVEVVGSAQASSVTVDRTGSWSLVEPARTAAVRDGRRSITSDCRFAPGRDCGGHLRIVVPADLPVTVSTGDGGLWLADLGGPVTATTTDGEVHARGLTGALSVTTSDGGLTGIELRSAEVAVTSGDGTVALAFEQPPELLAVRSGDGRVDVAVPDDGDAYRVDARADDATATVTVPTDQRADRRIDVHTGDGPIRITPAR